MPVTRAPTDASPFVVDPTRTAMAMMYLERGQIGQRVLPFTPLLAQPAFTWHQWDLAAGFTIPDTSVGRISRPPRVEFQSEEREDRTEPHGLMDIVPAVDQDEVAAAANSAALDPIDAANLFLAHLLRLANERDVADAVFNPASYPADHQIALGAGNRFDDDASDPWEVLMDGLAVPIFRPNQVIFGEKVWQKFARHPEVVKAIKPSGADAGIATVEAVARELQVPEVLIGRTHVNHANEGQPLVRGNVWGNHVAMLHHKSIEMGGGAVGGEPEMVGDARRPTFGFQARYQDLNSLTRFDPELGEKGATSIIVRESRKAIVAARDLGYLISTPIAP